MAPLARRRYDILAEPARQARAWAWVEHRLGRGQFLGMCPDWDIQDTDIVHRWAHGFVNDRTSVIWVPAHHATLLDLACP